MTTHSLSGHIFERGTPRGVPNLRIEAWDSEPIVSDVIAVATTDADGCFTITLDSEYLRSHFGDRSPSLTFRVFRTLRIALDGGGFATTYTNLITPDYLWKLAVGTTVVRLEVDLAAGAGRELPTPSIVRGVVRTAAGAPVIEATVSAYDQNLNRDEIIGSSVTDSAGRYQITYIELYPTGKIRPDLVVRAVGHEYAVLAESERICHAPATVTVNLSVGGEYRGPSEYDALVSRLAPLTAGFELADATAEHIERLACSVETDTGRISSLAAASALSVATGIAAPVVYGLVRKGIPATRRELLTTRPVELRRALEGALADNLVPATLTATLDATMADLRQATIALAFEAPPETATGSLGDLLATVLPTRAIQEELLDAYLTHTGTLEDFWHDLGHRASFEAEGTIANIQLAFQLGALTRQHFPLLVELQARIAAGTSTSLRQLAGYSEADWVSVLERPRAGGGLIGYPADIPGASDTEKKANYARVLKSTMEAAFPTESLKHELERSAPSGGLSLTRFFDENLSFEFGKTRVGDYLAKNTSALGSYGDPGEKASVVAKLKAVERLSRVTLKPSEIMLFLGDGHDSARSVLRMGKGAFTARYGAALGGTEATEAIFNRAASAADHALGLYTMYSPALNPTLGYGLPSYVPGPDPQAAPIADYKTLFGSADGCECEHCSSVYGPAAYLVDLLQFLGMYPSKLSKGGGEFWSAREVLIGSPPELGQPSKLRRPDIGWIALSCENTDTPLPYVDLVNEILEHSIAATPAPYEALIATEGTAEDLAALPQILTQESGPRGAAYATLATAVVPFEAPFHLWAEEARVYLQHLGVPRGTLMRILRKELADPGAAKEQRALIAAERVGLTPYEREVITGVAITTPVSVNLWDFWGLASSFALHDLESVPTFLQHSGLELADLLELVDCAFLKSFSLTVSPVPGGSACQPDQLRIAWGLDAGGAWSVLHRFLRLQRRLGWSIRELDQVVMASGGTIDDDCLEVIAVVLRLHAEWEVPIPVLASWFGNLDTQARDGGATPGYYKQVFQNKAVPGSEALALGALSGTALLTHADALRGALRIDAADFARLTSVAALRVDVDPLAESPIAGLTANLGSLSKLHRIVTFSRAAGLSIKDFLLLGHLSGILDQTTVGTGGFEPAEVEAFLEMVATVKRSKLTLVDAAYLLCRRELPGVTVIPDDAAVRAMLAGLYKELLKIRAEPEDAQLRLIRQTLSASLKLDLGTTKVLLDELLTQDGPPSNKLITAFELPSELSGDPPEPPALLSNEAKDEQVKAYRHLAVAAKLIGKLELTAAEVSVLGASLFVLDATPRSPSAADADRFASFLTLVELRSFRSSLTGADQGLLSIFSASVAEDMNNKATVVNRVTGWPAADITALVTAFNRTLGIANDVIAPARTLLRLREAFVALKRLGVPAAKALGWIDTGAPLSGPAGTTAQDIATSVVQASKSKYGAEGWAAVAPPIRDVLREKQRKVLVAYLVAKNGYADSDALFARLLVDVETSPAQLTSRIKQALGSVQTFVQRSFLNLEEDVVLSAEAAHQWEWMKSYRVWEANRKIFLYPENWIEPELRDDKSPFFKALESELRQKDMTTEVAEAAYERYLERLGDVAHLDVVAMVHEVEEAEGLHASIDVLHVVGRTTTAPHKHFYRTRVDAQWTAWEAIDVEIESDHLLLMVINRRLHLFWALIEEQVDAEQPKGDIDKSGQEAQTHLEIRLAWSEHRGQKWTARKLNLGGALEVGRSLLLPDLPDVQYLSLIPARLFQASEPVITLWRKPVVLGKASAFMSYQGRFSIDLCGDNVEAIRLSSSTVKVQDESELLVLPSGSSLRAQDAVHPSASDLRMPFSDEGPVARYVVLAHAPRPYRVLSQHRLMQYIDTDYGYADNEVEQLFYKDGTRTFFAEIETETTISYLQASSAFPGLPAGVTEYSSGFMGSGMPGYLKDWAKAPPAGSVILLPNTIEWRGFRFSPFYHPYACLFLRELHRSGVDGLLKWSMNEHPIQLTNDGLDRFELDYQPNQSVTLKPYPVEDVDFAFRGAYSLYNWELFFHAPFLIATRLMQNQRFAEAQRWFHYIFDPTSGGEEKAPKRFWKVRPFYENLDLASIEEELTHLAEAWSRSTKTLANLLEGQLRDPGVKDLQDQIEASRREPFNPHLIARMRPLAYQKAVFVKYIQNLFTWGDQLFRRDTIEAINEATQLYILAGSLLGKRPRRVRSRTAPTARSYWDLDAAGLDPFADAIVEAESLGSPAGAKIGTGYFKQPAPDLRLLAFCVPPNDAMLDLWDTVADRLFKIRHSMNLEGVVRQLPLFEPPIDPALLVQATALGVDLATAIADASSALSRYRFSVMHGKAMEICGSVIGLGGAFLSALEKKDAEGLSRLRSRHEIEMLKLVRETKAKQLKDAENNLVALERSFDVVQTRYDYYRQISPISAAETEALTVSGAAALTGVAAQLVASLAPAAQHVPTITFGTAGTMGSPVTLNAQGGGVEAPAVAQEGQALSMAAGLLRDEASVIATLASYERRADDWKLQERLAQKEIVQMQKQIVGAKIRVAIAEADLAHHDRQIEQTQEVDAYLRDKLTSEALYDRMIDKLSVVYFESYKLAYDVARKAEKAFKFELGIEKTSPNMVTFGYWDSLKQGLLAGEQLQHDLRRLEVAYLDQNARELEITKHISLAEIDPAKLLTLRETGTCEIELEEEIFDADYPQHYMRRIKTVSVTLPAVTGPYTGVSCTLLLENNRTRKSDAVGSSYAHFPGDTRFYAESTPRGPVVTSSAQNDAGLFEVNLRDERYLPFEGAGVIGTWSVSLSRETNGFDISTIDDVILHVRYTARVATSLDFLALTKPKPAKKRIFSARAEFPDQWALLMNPLPGADQTLTFALDRALFPHVVSTKKILLTSATIYARWSDAKSFSATPPLAIEILRPGLPALEPQTLTLDGSAKNLVATPTITLTGTQGELGNWTINISSDVAAHLIEELRTDDSDDNPRLDGTLQDIWLVCDYDTVSLSSLVTPGP